MLDRPMKKRFTDAHRQIADRQPGQNLEKHGADAPYTKPQMTCPTFIRKTAPRAF